jgi:hypothetical protein
MKKVPSRRGHTAEQAAEHLYLSPRRFFELVAAGVIPRAPRRGYRLDDVRKRYFAHLRRDVARQSLIGERAALTRAVRETAAIKNAVSRGDFVPRDVFQTILASTFDNLRKRALAICKIAPAIAFKTRGDAEAALRDEIHAALSDMALGKKGAR